MIRYSIPHGNRNADGNARRYRPHLVRRLPERRCHHRYCPRHCHCHRSRRHPARLLHPACAEEDKRLRVAFCSRRRSPCVRRVRVVHRRFVRCTAPRPYRPLPILFQETAERDVTTITAVFVENLVPAFSDRPYGNIDDHAVVRRAREAAVQLRSSRQYGQCHAG